MSQKFSRRRVLQIAAAGAAIPLVAGCVGTNKATGRTSFTGVYDIDDEIKIGREQAPKLTQQFGGEYEDTRLQNYVQKIGLKAAEHTEYQQFEYNFTLLNSPIVNAFALPGGYCFCTRGLMALASSEAELVGVLSHELGHVNARHSAERMSQGMLAQFGVAAAGVFLGQAGSSLASMGAQTFIQSYSRGQEFEADSLGVRYMSKAGYDPDAMVSFLDTLRDHSVAEAKMMGLPEGKVDEFNIMSTHPRTVDRVEAAVKQAEGDRPDNPVLNQKKYYDKINGMLYGDDPEQGIIHGVNFAHPSLRISFDVPEGFRISNQPTRVVAQGPDQSGFIFDMARIPENVSMSDYIKDHWLSGGTVNNLESIEINNQKTATGDIRTKSGVDVRLVAIRGDNDQVFRLAYISKPENTKSLRKPFKNSAYSFRRLSKEEAEDIKPNRLIIVPVGLGDSIEMLASHLPYGEYNEDVFRVLNDLKPGDALPTSGMIKVITS